MPQLSPFAAVSNTKLDEDRITWGLLLIYVLSTVYVAAIATQAPMLPYLWDDLGGTTVGYGIMMSEFGALQLVGNLLSGPLIDVMGARFWFGVSFLAAATVAACTALATQPWMLYASRLPAVLELATLCAKVLITERSSEAGRARMIGYNGVALGVGFVAGPTVGGFLSHRSNQLCAWVASAMCLGGLLFVPLIRPVTDHAYAPFSEDSETPQETPQAVGSLRGSSSSPRQASRAFSQHLRMRSDSQDWKRSSSQDKPRTGNAEKPRSAHPVKLRSSHSDKPRNNSRGRLKAEGEEKVADALQTVNSHAPGVASEAAILASVGHFLPEAAGTPQANAARSVPEESGHIVEAHWEYDPETGRSPRWQPPQPPKRKANMKQLITTLVEPGVPSVVAVKVLVGLGLGVLQTTLSLLLDKHYHLPAQASGAFLSYVGVLAILVQGLLIGPISRNVSVHMVVLTCGWGAAASFGGFALSGPNVWLLVAACGPLICCIIILETICTAQLTKLAPTGCKGTVLAIDAGIMGAMGMVAPSIGTGLYAGVGFPSLGIFGSGLCVVLMGLLHLGVIVV